MMVDQTTDTARAQSLPGLTGAVFDTQANTLRFKGNYFPLSQKAFDVMSTNASDSTAKKAAKRAAKFGTILLHIATAPVSLGIQGAYGAFRSRQHRKDLEKLLAPAIELARGEFMDGKRAKRIQDKAGINVVIAAKDRKSAVKHLLDLERHNFESTEFLGGILDHLLSLPKAERPDALRLLLGHLLNSDTYNDVSRDAREALASRITSGLCDLYARRLAREARDRLEESFSLDTNIAVDALIDLFGLDADDPAVRELLGARVRDSLRGVVLEDYDNMDLYYDHLARRRFGLDTPQDAPHSAGLDDDNISLAGSDFSEVASLDDNDTLIRLTPGRVGYFETITNDLERLEEDFIDCAEKIIIEKRRAGLIDTAIRHGRVTDTLSRREKALVAKLKRIDRRQDLNNISIQKLLDSNSSSESIDRLKSRNDQLNIQRGEAEAELNELRTLFADLNNDIIPDENPVTAKITELEGQLSEIATKIHEKKLELQRHPSVTDRFRTELRVELEGNTELQETNARVTTVMNRVLSLLRLRRDSDQPLTKYQSLVQQFKDLDIDSYAAKAALRLAVAELGEKELRTLYYNLGKSLGVERPPLNQVLSYATLGYYESGFFEDLGRRFIAEYIRVKRPRLEELERFDTTAITRVL